MDKALLAQRKKRAEVILRELKKLFPKASIMLKYSNPWELLVAVILSAQCTDKKVNEVTEKLFKKYKRLEDYVKANPSEFERDIYSTGFYKAKTKNVLATAKIVYEKHKGRIPSTMEELLGLPGVARKTANIVLGNVYHIYEGIAVDTHVKRLSNVLGLTTQSDPNKIEQELMQIIPEKEWFSTTYRLIEYGRKYCVAKRHNHEDCPLSKVIKN
ncbi:endonuclease III [Candidatus Roizmanbacteria bacterium RIFCSPHIGHO2_12_FULL_40_130]|nr:MAG: endonuclease III [Candidatus Roizmanbacteria bacterium RIFCSPHIGHO2_01_FULL_40_98]OGK28930.1 MAG: endonuclease III [Candidatus Roizmanbacteria bacterium RIFCSPHIGHO2_02_FULL_40_53]OGK29604.1 MAG: endonuclease III [Candidatus Roizmanbacteria bacterium RIFCSPHIGHO2_12_41_18]OGK36691.1 MAG: endonuclease III [Candidatus Roizmanbacteria bacterium RIFCSPHIGHO2_12_FULL_40_130]OGK59515.1 MAG: endonuclease III [Candidatus Roizmanbacteria bacterium RIFCSPLOWO2_02_FULL_40_13]